jgi:hypothetical protein
VVLLQESPEPALGGKTNKDLAAWALALRAALRQANADKRDLRAWLAGQEPLVPASSGLKALPLDIGAPAR